MNSYIISWWSLLLINWPRDDERLSWPCWLTYSGRFTYINGCPSAAGQVQTSESSPVRDRRSTTESPNLMMMMMLQIIIMMIWWWWSVYVCRSTPDCSCAGFNNNEVERFPQRHCYSRRTALWEMFTRWCCVCWGLFHWLWLVWVSVGVDCYCVRRFLTHRLSDLPSSENISLKLNLC